MQAILASTFSKEPLAFEALMRRHNQRLFRAVRSIVKDDADAEDVLQNAYLKIYQAIGSFRGDAQLSNWLTRIVVNEAIGHLRRKARRVEAIQLFGDDEPEVTDTAAHESPESTAMAGQTRSLLERKIDGLPDVYRTVFVLRALEEMSSEEVALALSIPVPTVRTRFFRARGLLREALARELDMSLNDAFAFDGARCDRLVAGVLKRLAELDVLGLLVGVEAPEKFLLRPVQAQALTCLMTYSVNVMTACI